MDPAIREIGGSAARALQIMEFQDRRGVAAGKPMTSFARFISTR
jgi:hypothetical protein